MGFPAVRTRRVTVQGVPLMVNRKRIKRMIPNLVLDSNTTKPENWRKYVRARRRFIKLSFTEQEKIVTELERLMERVEKQLAL
jgi:RNase P protein component